MGKNASTDTLVLVRHGETEANVARIWHGSLDAPLTDRGRGQVAATAERFGRLAATYDFDRLFVSPLPRARKTAGAIATVIGLESMVDAGLREFGLGDWEGRSFSDLRATENLWARWARDPTFAPPNGESPQTFGARVVQAFGLLTERYPGETIVAVTHGAVISNLLSSWLDTGPQQWRRWEAHNCAISILTRRTGEPQWRDVMINSIEHLGPDLRHTDAPSDYSRND